MNRPKTRGECIDGMRPCPWVGCRHHLYLDVVVIAGKPKIMTGFPTLQPWEMPYTCSLDVADEGPRSLDEIGCLIGEGPRINSHGALSRERVRQIINDACEKLLRVCRAAKLEPDLDCEQPRSQFARFASACMPTVTFTKSETARMIRLRSFRRE